jgi:hypothetical protein
VVVLEQQDKETMAEVVTVLAQDQAAVAQEQ